MLSPADHACLQAAIELARRGLFSTAPNPRVGCLIVREGVAVGRGWHERCGEAHAEAKALADAGEAAAGATAYVSLEPCCVQGRTPPCADALIRARIARVVAAMRDPDPRVNGRGFERLREAEVAVATAELAEAQALNCGWIKRLRTGRPWVRVKVALSLDGRTAMASGESKWISGEEARADVQYWRARSCAIITGAGTVRADNPRLTVRDERFRIGGRIRQPLRVVVSGQSTLDPAPALRDGGPVLVARGREGEASPPARTFPGQGGRVNLEALLDHLGERECNEVLVEAGAMLVGAFVEADLWDELIVYVAPKLLGSAGRPFALLPLERMEEAVAGRIGEEKRLGEDLRLTIRR